MPVAPKRATPVTASVNREAVARYDMADRADFADADRGLIAGLPERKLLHADGQLMFDFGKLDYITDRAQAPDTVNPSLWRQSQVMRRGGLYQVTDGLYQVRNNDIASLTIIEGDSGLVIIDCTASVEAAAQGMELFSAQVSDKPVVAVIYTHTHIDHYGGVKGVVDAADVASGKVPIIAPARPEPDRTDHLRHRRGQPAWPHGFLHLAHRRHHPDRRHPRTRRADV